MRVWLWSATGPQRFEACGITDGGAERARELAGGYLASGQADRARVEIAIAVLGGCSMRSHYMRTGDGWTAQRPEPGPDEGAAPREVTWTAYRVRAQEPAGYDDSPAGDGTDPREPARATDSSAPERTGPREEARQ